MRRSKWFVAALFLIIFALGYFEPVQGQTCAQNVSWTNAVGVSASGNSLTKTAGAAWGNGGAASTQTIVGDGYVQFTASETNSYRMIGLSQGEDNQNYTDIDFAFYTAADGQVYVYENGVYRGVFGAYATGDTLRVAVEAGVVKYRKNGILLYTSGVVPSYPLLADTSLYSQGSTLNNVVISGNPTSANTQTFSWTNVVGVSVSGNNLTKTTATGWGNAGAASTQTISGDGYVETTVGADVSLARLIGLSDTDPNQHYTSVDFGLLMNEAFQLIVFESGTNRGTVGTYTSGDILRIAVEGGVVKYRKNGTLLYTSTVAPSYPLRVDVALYSQGSTLKNVVLNGKPQTPTSYTVTDLGTLGGDGSKALGINNAGVIVGGSEITPGFMNTRPFIWVGGVMSALASYDGSASSISESGFVAGTFNPGGNVGSRPFLWSPCSGLQDLGPIVVGGQSNSAFGINSASPLKVVGVGEVDPNTLSSRGFVWTNTTPPSEKEIIQNGLGGSDTWARGINNLGQIVGNAKNSQSWDRAFIRNGTQMTDLGTISTGRWSRATAINNSSVVVGYSEAVWPTPMGSSDQTHAFIKTPTSGMTDIGTLGGSQSQAYGLNEWNVIVGWSFTANWQFYAFVYDSVNGIRNLNTLTAGSGWTLQWAQGINNKGQIVGYGVNPSGKTRAFLLTPVP